MNQFIIPRCASIALLVALSLSGCAQYATVSEKQPRFTPVRSTIGPLVKAEQDITQALATSKREPLAALGGFLYAADEAAAQLNRTPTDRAARESYNFAVARIFDALKEGRLDPWTQPLRAPAPGGGEYLLTRKPDPRKAWNPALYDFTPADEFDIGGTYVQKRDTKEGVGAPIVAVGRLPNAEAAANFGMPKTYYGVTAILRFEGKRALMGFEDPLATETTEIGGRTFPLAADFTVPVAVMLARENPKRLELARALNPAKFANTARIVRMQPYDPNKTVVLFVHGLIDSAATWAPMINSLRSDPLIREKYQFWYYSYPSGYPYPYSAAIMRRQLDGVEKRFPLQRKIVVVGHSMGSLITRLMITDTGDKLWEAYFGKTPAQTRLSDKTKATLEDALIFRHRPEIGRVIFISGPHRGSDLATNWFGRLASSLIKAPVTLMKIGDEVRQVVTSDTGAMRLNRIPNSVDMLAPNNRFVMAINTIPLAPGIPFHSIMGDRGKGGNKDHTPPVSSDGVVPYWSSHLDGAQSELIVPSGHQAHQNPQAIAEVHRILLLNAGLSGKN
jgi:pimeloyl-ACP methyl ester carboxylesterase